MTTILKPSPAVLAKVRIPDRDTEGTARWFAVHCQPCRERVAACNLANQSFKVFLPSREKTRRHARKLETIRAPLFPSYLFVELDLARDRWRSVNGTPGVIRLVSNRDTPAAAPRGVVESLIDACDKDGLIAWRPDLKLGQQVRVANGPFADLVGELAQMTDAGRVRVLLDILGGRTAVLLSHADIASI